MTRRSSQVSENGHIYKCGLLGKQPQEPLTQAFLHACLQLNDVFSTLGWVNPPIVSAVTSMMKFASPDNIQGNIEVQIIMLFMNCNSVVCRT